MKKNILIVIVLVFTAYGNAQSSFLVEPYQDTRVITTGMPFLLIAPDARAAAMGDMGVATSVDAFSQKWNPAKYVFSTAKSGISLSYTPYLSKLVNDIGIGYVSYFNRIDEQSAFGASLTYFSLGEIEFVKDENSTPLIQKPNELALDLSYSLRLSDQFGMAVAMRYLRSDLKLQTEDGQDLKAASTFGVDITGYYQSEEEAYNDFNGRWRGGFALQNLGPKFNYDEGGQENFQPTTLRLGGGFDFIFDQYNKLGATVEFSKLLVPTPPVLGKRTEYTESGENEGYQAGEDVLIAVDNDYIIDGQDNDVDFMSGIFQSFGDAPGGGKEELQEFTYAVGLEYLYQDSFAFRAGYFNEHETKGARKFFALGAGFKYNVLNLDLSYLFSASKVQSPLESTLRFSLTFNLGEGEYTEY
ncbi:type IX secretion system outer membrane channel protein PorV [Lacinutrix algicola]|uniref:type IX secretion system outer membrane channel protein PorV n=1 Tax=Lacinutrix algicola TaxID=342954 RepID=UPI0006E21990|nr:type IX secretion system outer membrane channel protein PorV [Lacinutrix algicola]